MSIRNLDHVFKPSSVAVFGASEREHAVGTVVLRNLLAAGFSGPIYAINPKYSTVQGQRCYRSIAELPDAIDLAVLCTPAATVPNLIEALVLRGTRAAIVISAGFNQTLAGESKTLQQSMVLAAKPSLLRIVGPNCIGIQIPSIGLNASFAHLNAQAGSLAFVSQSGAMITAVLDWAAAHRVGFSHVVSLGDMSDVDFGDTIDYLCADTATKAILLYIESISDARKFMSATRAASRLKPVIVIKAGRFASSAAAVTSHTGSLAGEDRVYDAALRRAGALRVFDTQELFAAVETLALSTPLNGERLAILTNGGGLGVLAADCFAQMRGTLAKFEPSTIERLNAVLPTTWSHGNPVDIIGDASPQRYQSALDLLLTDKNTDAVLVLNCPTAVQSNLAIAKKVCESVSNSRQPVFTCWAGEQTATQARDEFIRHGIPTYETPELAIRGFMHRVQLRRNQQALQQLPSSTIEEFQPDRAVVRGVIDRARADNFKWLSEVSAKEIVSAYGIPTVRTLFASTPKEAAAAAEKLATTCVLKIVSRDILHKSDVGGVVLDLKTPRDVEVAAQAMFTRIKREHPDAKLDGFTAQPKVELKHARELIVGLKEDAQFGPVIMFGQGGVDVEALNDITVELVPLNRELANAMIERTRVARLLQAHRGNAAADIDGIATTLIRISQLAIDFAEIVEIDINPLLVNEQEIIALDVRIRIAEATRAGTARFAIRPYPRELQKTLQLRDGSKLLLRPVRPEDAHAFATMFREISPEDIRLRFFQTLKSLPDSLAARLTQIDYDREMAFVAIDAEDPTKGLGVVRLACDPDLQRGEFAVLVHSKAQRQGLGTLLMREIERYARDRGVLEMFADVLKENSAMLQLCRELGFALATSAEAGWIVRVTKQLA